MTRREHPRRRRLQVIRHAAPEEALAAMHEPPTGPLPVLEDECACPTLRPGESCPAHPFDTSQFTPPRPGEFTPADVSRETPPPLSRAQVLRLEALTARWEREVRTSGPADATLLYAAPRLPPVPPPAGRRDLEDDTPPPPAVDVDAAAAEEASARLLEAEEAHDAAHAVQVAERLADLRRMTEADAISGPGGQATHDQVGDPIPPARVHDWASRHDARSLEYAVRGRLEAAVPLQEILLERGPVMDQGTTPPLSVREASGCVGFAITAAANVLDAMSRPPSDRQAADTFRDTADARRAYRLAQERDHVSGSDYPGTSVLAGMKAGQELGWWDTYLWALGGTKDVAQALLQLHAPVVIGIPWDAGLEAPDALGVIAPGGASAGGHALAVVGLRRITTRAGAGWYFVLQQSRGTSEGVDGLVYLHHKHMGQLLAGSGEAAVPLPRWGLS